MYGDPIEEQREGEQAGAGADGNDGQAAVPETETMVYGADEGGVTVIVEDMYGKDEFDFEPRAPARAGAAAASAAERRPSARDRSASQKAGPKKSKSRAKGKGSAAGGVRKKHGKKKKKQK